MTEPFLALFCVFLISTASLQPSFVLIPQQETAEKAQSKTEKPIQKEDKPAQEKKSEPKEEKTKEDKAPKAVPDVVTDGSVIIAGQKVEYRATAGMLPSVDKSGKAKAKIFYVAYTRKTGEPASTRRLTFCFTADLALLRHMSILASLGRDGS